MELPLAFFSVLFAVLSVFLHLNNNFLLSNADVILISFLLVILTWNPCIIALCIEAGSYRHFTVLSKDIYIKQN